MPRPSWSGHLRLSLVSCPIYLSPATTKSERIRLNPINPGTGNRIALRTVDSETGEELDRSQIVKGYQYDKGQYVILDKEDLDQIQIESTKILDLTTFVDRAWVNPLFLDAPYYIDPEGKTGIEAFRAIAQALINRKKAAIGRIVLSSREHPVMVEPFGEGLVMSILRTADEVCEAQCDLPNEKLDPEMIQLAETILDRLAGAWEPTGFHHRYQDALRALVEAKVKGLPTSTLRPVSAPSNVVDLMGALKKSLAQNALPAAGIRGRRGRADEEGGGAQSQAGEYPVAGERERDRCPFRRR